MEYQSRYADCLGFEVHFTEWGHPESPVVIAWHGLARTGRDMDELARFLCPHYRVICPDTIGRGLSQWSTRPEADYCLESYARIAAALLDRLEIDSVHWVGTSMGGAIGQVCASGLVVPELKEKIVSLTLNDAAPELARPAIERIKQYAGNPPAFSSVLELEGFYRKVYEPFGWMSDAQWRHLTETSTRRLPDGKVTPHYDPDMVIQFIAHPDDYALWPHYDALVQPVLCLHGVQSDLVLPHVIQEMKGRGPGARGQLHVLEVEGCGHAPALNVPEQLAPIRAFVRSAEVTGMA